MFRKKGSQVGTFFKKHWFKMLAGTLATGLLVMITWNLWWGTHRLPVAFRAPEFNLTDTDGKQVSLESLDKKIKVISFVYTNCPDACPMTLYYYEQAQEELKDAGLFGEDVELLSISMDPERDDAKALQEYGEKFDADFSGWKFLRGDRPETDRVMKGFNFEAVKGPDGNYEHSNRVFLIDGNRNVRTTYILQDEEGKKQLVSDLKNLAAE